MVVRLIKLNAWFAFACGVFCLMVAPMIVDYGLVSLGLRKDRIIQDESYLLATTFIRMVGVLLFAYALMLRLVLKHSFDPENVRSFLGLFAVGLLVWGGMFLFLILIRSPLLAFLAGVGLLEWLLVAAILLFEYKKTEDWHSVKPKE
jgi:hypothetical protein